MVVAKARGCGMRVAGGIYLEVPTGKYGAPVEYFLQDPPVPIDPDALGVSPIGIKIIEMNGVHHVLDWVGSEHYPNVADFVEEVRRMGVSRRISRREDFSLLTRDSKLLLIHSRAHIRNFMQFFDALSRTLEPDANWLCPKDISGHGRKAATLLQASQMCAGLWWEDVEGGEAEATETDDPLAFADALLEHGRRVVRTMPSFAYMANRTPAAAEPAYQPAIFAAFPIRRIAVIEGEGAEDAAALARKASVPVVIEEA